MRGYRPTTSISLIEQTDGVQVGPRKIYGLAGIGKVSFPINNYYILAFLSLNSFWRFSIWTG
jgi:hypothetical protein